MRCNVLCFTFAYESSDLIILHKFSHWSVITQMWGSQWPKVCLILLLLMYSSTSFGFYTIWLTLGIVLTEWCTAWTLIGDTILLVQCSTNGSTYDFRSQIWIQSCRNIKSRPYIRHGKQMYPLNVLLDRSNITSNAAMFFMHALKLHWWNNS